MDIFRDLRNLIIENRLKEALEKLPDLASDDDMRNQIILLTANFNDIEKGERLGTESKEYLDIKKNKLIFSILNLVSDVESKKADDSLWSKAVKCQDSVESAIVELSDKVESLMGEMISYDVIQALKSSSSADHKEIIKMAVENHKNVNKPYLDEINKTLSELKSIQNQHKNKMMDLVHLLENNPRALTESYIKHRHNESKVEFYQNQISEYKNLYTDLRKNIAIGGGTLLAFISTVFAIKYSRLRDVDKVYDHTGFDIFGYNYSGINPMGCDPLGTSILVSEVGILSAAAQIDSIEGVDPDIDTEGLVDTDIDPDIDTDIDTSGLGDLLDF